MLWKKRLLTRSTSPRPIHCEFQTKHKHSLHETQQNESPIRKTKHRKAHSKSKSPATIVDILLEDLSRDVITCHFCGRCVLIPINRVERDFGGILLALRGIPLLASFEWLVGWTTQLALFITYAKAIELLIICYFYLDLASKIMHWSSLAGKRLCFSSLILLFTYFTLFLVMGFLLSIEPWTDCHAPYWIWFSCGEFLTVQLMVFSFLLIVNRMNRISASPNIHQRQRRQLFTLFWVFETSCLADLGYHISLYILADDEKGCSGDFCKYKK
ncbi:unnamed protein product, partial [Mesorhabditis belari]|uniref:Transmembrane protein n=1 Tax=Mesorhabditis belari TaxID=2138241 RepID=A0AAF3F1H1_9BILA